MAIVAENTSSQAYNNSDSSYTLSHTCTGANFLVVCVAEASGNGPSGVTYNGTAMTKSAQYASFKHNSIWTLADPSSGTNNVVVSIINGQGGIIGAISFTGTNKTTDGSNASNTYTTGTSQQANFTTTYDNTLIVCSAYVNAVISSYTLTEQASQTQKWLKDAATPYKIGACSTKATTTAGAKTVGYDGSGGSALQVISLGIRESAPVAPTVTTQAATLVTKNSFTGNGNITATGGANATRRGFCYKVGTSGDPTVADSIVYDDGDFGTGAFSENIT